MNSSTFTELFSSEIYKTWASATLCTQAVKIYYESPTTIALTSKYSDALWQDVDLIKKDGYRMDGFTSYSAEAALTIAPSIHTAVVMSK